MIVVKLQGGLGNQMFQYSLGRFLSINKGMPLRFDMRSLEETLPDTTPRSNELGIFGMETTRVGAHDLSCFFPLSVSHPVGQLFFRLIHKVKRYSIVREPHFHYNGSVVETSASEIYLDGFWQSEKYFAASEKQIRADFEFKQVLNSENNRLLKHITSVQSVSIHVRRGDYLTMPSATTHHQVCSIDYYKNAIQEVAKRIVDPVFFIFSDEPEWVKANLILEYPFTIVSHNTGSDSYIDLRLMSSCQHQIIANSSFSWWGAWLNPSKEKNVVAPKTWFKDSSIDISDLLPSEWIKI